MVLLIQTISILFLMTSLVMPRIFNPSFETNLIVWLGQDANSRS